MKDSRNEGILCFVDMYRVLNVSYIDVQFSEFHRFPKPGAIKYETTKWGDSLMYEEWRF